MVMRKRQHALRCKQKRLAMKQNINYLMMLLQMNGLTRHEQVLEHVIMVIKFFLIQTFGSPGDHIQASHSQMINLNVWTWFSTPRLRGRGCS